MVFYVTQYVSRMNSIFHKVLFIYSNSNYVCADRETGAAAQRTWLHSKRKNAFLLPLQWSSYIAFPIVTVCFCIYKKHFKAELFSRVNLHCAAAVVDLDRPPLLTVGTDEVLQARGNSAAHFSRYAALQAFHPVWPYRAVKWIMLQFNISVVWWEALLPKEHIIGNKIYTKNLT